MSEIYVCIQYLVLKWSLDLGSLVLFSLPHYAMSELRVVSCGNEVMFQGAGCREYFELEHMPEPRYFPNLFQICVLELIFSTQFLNMVERQHEHI